MCYGPVGALHPADLHHELAKIAENGWFVTNRLKQHTASPAGGNISAKKNDS